MWPKKIKRFQVLKFEVFSREFKSITKVLPVSRTEIHPIAWRVAWRSLNLFGFLHFPPAMILRYFSALWAALALAASMLGAKPWHTVIGCVESSTRHWHRPLRLRSSATERHNKVKIIKQTTQKETAEGQRPCVSRWAPTHPGPGSWCRSAAPGTAHSAVSRSWSRRACWAGGCAAPGSSHRQSYAGSPTCSWSLCFCSTQPCSPCAVRAQQSPSSVNKWCNKLAEMLQFWRWKL